MGSWDIVLFVIAAYVAVVTLVRLMRRLRDGLVTNMRAHVEAERRRQRAARRKNRRSQGPADKAV